MIHTSLAKRWLNEASSGRPVEFCMVLGVATVQGFLWAMMVPVIPLFARSLGASEMEIGTIAIVPSIIAIVFSIPGGALANRYGKRTAFIASQLFSVMGGILMYAAAGLGYLILPQLLLGLSNMLFWPTEKAYLTELIPVHLRTRVVSYSMAVSAGGSILGPAFGGYLIDNAGFKTVFVAFMVISAAGALLAMALPAMAGNKDVSVLQTLVDGMSGCVRLAVRPVLTVTTILTFFQFFSQGITEYFAPVFLKEVGYSATLIGTTVALRTAGMTSIRFVLAEVAARVGSMRLLFIGLGVCAVSMGLAPLFPVPSYVMPAFFVMGMAFGVAPVLTAAIIAENTEAPERNLGMALDSTSMYTARVMSGLAIGGIAQTTGIGNAIQIGYVIVLVGLVFTVAIDARLRQRQPVCAAD